MKINICFSTDNNYIKPLYSSITSILKNADIDTDLNIFILENDLSDKNKNILLNLKTIKECEIKFIKIETTLISDLPDFKENLNYISKTSFFRFFVADLLKDIDKIIYLDCDIIVLSDLKSLFIQDIQNNYIAAVEDIGYYCNLSKHKYLKNFDFYINAGVLLINLQIWRQKKLSLTLSNIGKQKIKDFIFLDQDILNVVCKNKIKLLDFSYNVQTDCLKKGILSKHPKKKRIKEDIKKTKIIHYTSSK
ncbi:MAG: glycosyltransferase family 8 protein [Elusimicrobia bacterium]|nr:glycosyltransferase family 8 protein [Elusimicrobiota bacterium]